jgi:hypothetical protein
MATATTQGPAAPGDAIPEWVKEDWKTAYLRVKGTAPAARMWQRVLTPDDQRRLGGDLDAAYARHGGAVGMWIKLHGVSVPRAVVAVAVAIGFLDAGTGQALLRALGEEPDDPEEALEMAVASGALVLAVGPRRAYWEGESITIDWERHDKPWAFLDELARAAKAGAALDPLSLRERGGRDTDFLKKRKCALVNALGFPLTLADLVVPAGRGTYRLDLLPARIRVFERGAGDAVREWTP